MNNNWDRFRREANPVEQAQYPVAGYAFSVDEGAVARFFIAQHKLTALLEDFRVLARHFLAGQLEVVFGVLRS